VAIIIPMARSDGTHQARATTSASRMAAPRKSAVTLRPATTPDTACETGTSPTDAKMIKLIIRPMNRCGVRAWIHVKNVTMR